MFTDDLIGIHDLTLNGGSPLPRRSTLNIIGTGVTAVDNPITGQTDVTLPNTVGGATISPAPLGSSVNDYSPTGHATAAVERWSSGSTPVDVTGLVINVGSATITFIHSSLSSAAGNRFVCPANADFALPAGGAVELVRDVTSACWRIVS
jgi:hypothetical protein